MQLNVCKFKSIHFKTLHGNIIRLYFTEEYQSSLEERQLCKEGEELFCSFSLLAFLSRLTIMMGVVVATFLLCWFPFGLMFAGSPFSRTVEQMFDKHQGLIDLVTWIGKLAWIGSIS